MSSKSVLPVVSMLVALTWFLAGCSDMDSRADYWDFKDIPTDGWKRDAQCEFHPAPVASDLPEGGYNLVLVVRHSTEYPGRNLSLRIENVDSVGHSSADTITLQLADHRGLWLGQGTRTLYEVSDTLSRNFQPDPNSRIFISHCMDTPTLRGVNKLGLMLVK